MTRSYGERLHQVVLDRGPMCAGIDPHPGLLRSWGLAVDASGLERCARTMVEALGVTVAVFKPQSAFFEAHGSAGVAVLERTLADIAGTGALALLDVKRGDIGSTTQAYADAYLDPSSPLAADAITAFLPPSVTLDTFEGRAYLGVVPFLMRDVSPWWSPSVPGVSTFPELNVRTYVRQGDRRALQPEVRDYEPGVALFGGTAQLVVTWLIHVTGSELAPAWYLVAAYVLGSAAGMLLTETAPARVSPQTPVAATA